MKMKGPKGESNACSPEDRNRASTTRFPTAGNLPGGVEPHDAFAPHQSNGFGNAIIAGHDEHAAGFDSKSKSFRDFMRETIQEKAVQWASFPGISEVKIEVKFADGTSESVYTDQTKQGNRP